MYIFCTGDMYMLCIGRGVCIYYLIIINRLIYLRDLQKIHNIIEEKRFSSACNQRRVSLPPGMSMYLVCKVL